jgi:predicted ATP-dependent serine protease
MQVTKRRGRPRKQQNIKAIPSLIDFKDITTLGNLNIDKRMLESMPTNINVVDEFLSHEQGIPCASNIMAIGDPGVGKTTVLLDILSKIEKTGRKCLFISGEMGEKQMYKYTQRFPQFKNVKTLFLSNYLEFNTKDVVEQVMDIGFDLILIDSIAEVMSGVRDDNGWDRKT